MLFFLGILLLNAYAMLLIVLRAPVYRTPLYRPMLWNIFLSVLPVGILLVGGVTGLTMLLVSPPAALVVLIVTAVVWLLLLPNASYLITELNQSHRTADDPVPLWYDIILVITLAMSGVMNTVANVLVAHIIFVLLRYGDNPGGADFANPGSVAFVGVVMLLLGFGMYLGRYPRFNSWDLRHPVGFVKKLVGHFRERGNLLACLGFTLTYAVFLALIYVITAASFIETMARAVVVGGIGS
ncbi:MAG: DUF1361 domain-containing protein [Microbacterium sp.]|nr:DUF1361 domain-containing protein [Microbacterium sp.]